MLPQDFLYQLKMANPIEQVMGRYVDLIRTGGTYKCRCPFHSERTPSCVVYANTQDPHFYCFGCHTGGDVITFIMKMENMPYIDAVKMLAENAGIPMPEQDKRDSGESNLRYRILELNREAARYFFSQLTGADKRGLAYLKNRALTPETIKKFGLGYAGDSWEGLCQAMRAKGFTEEELLAANLAMRNEKSGRLRDRFHSRVMFPIFDLRGSVIAFGGRTLDPDGKPKYLNSTDTLVYNKRRQLFALNIAAKSQSKRAILAEGYMDVIALHQAGFTNAVASLGTALTVEQCRLLQQHRFEEVVIAYDADFAGQDAAMRSLRAMREVGLRAYRLQLHDAKDPDEFIKKFGAPEFRRLLEHASGAVEFELAQCKTVPDEGTESGTVEALERSVKVLAQIENELEREVYISKTAKDYGVQPALLSAQVEKEVKKRSRREKKQAWTALTSAPMLVDPIVPDAAGKRREVKAEEMILSYLFRFPDELEHILAQISPEEFVTDLHRRIFTFLAEKLKEGLPFSVSLFSGDFTPDEMGVIAGIQAKYREIDIPAQAVADAVHVIRQEKFSAADSAEMDDASFAAMFDQLRQNKKGS